MATGDVALSLEVIFVRDAAPAGDDCGETGGLVSTASANGGDIVVGEVARPSADGAIVAGIKDSIVVAARDGGVTGRGVIAPSATDSRIAPLTHEIIPSPANRGAAGL